MKRFQILSLMALMALAGCTAEKGEQGVDGEPLFEQVPAAYSGLDFSNDLEENPLTRHNVLSYPHYYNGAGVAVGDVNNDGLPDLFFTGNEVPNRLYLNKGNLKFEDITERAGVNPPNKRWSTGAVFVDINGDGWQDIYVCQYGPYPPEERRNLLLIHNGDGEHPAFTEQAAAWGLDDPNESIQAAFFDYDKDGDLDCYVMNESKYALVVYQEVFEDLKEKENLEAASGKLFRNDGGKFTNVTEQAGLLRYGYGLGLVISDINQDGWLDIYVANDYSVPDFMWINNGDGTFTDRIKETTRQISFYGMGADIADFNNDAYPEIAVVDMASIDHFRDKTLMASMDVEGFWYFVNTLGYQYQYMFNTFQLNNGNGTFSNIANLAGIARSDWSWAALLADFDNDGWKDYFISTGYRRYARDNDFRNEMKAIRDAHGGTVPMEMRPQLYAKMPEISLPNFIYRNNRDLTFSNVTEPWGLNVPSFSNGAAYADLDGDGDLDLVVNNIDDKAFLFKNKASDLRRGHFLRFRLEGESPASPLIGTQILVKTPDGQLQYQEYGPVRGYMGCMENAVHFGLGDHTLASEVEVTWPDGRYQVLTNVQADQVLTLRQAEARQRQQPKVEHQTFPIEAVDGKTLGVDFVHRENPFNDFAKEVLLPHKQSTLGPKVSVADVNGDGLQDFFIGGAKGQGGALYLQRPDGTFVKGPSQPWAELDAASEDMDALFFDPDSDGDMDLYIVSGGGGDFEGIEAALQDRLYINLDGKGTFGRVGNALPEMHTSGNVARAADFDGDGDIDLFIGGAAKPGRYPYPDRSYLLRFDTRTLRFEDVTAELAPELVAPGMVKDALWTELNGDGFPDLVIVGEWMPIRIFLNEKGRLVDASSRLGTEGLKGWWYSIAQTDIDRDGDPDFVVGNLGLNGKFHASPDHPFNVFANDFDKNGTCDIVLTKEYKGRLVPTRGRQCSSEQMPFIKDKFPTYRDFANADIEQIFGKKNLEEALHLQVTTFASGVLINEGAKGFSFRTLPNEAQIAPINGIIVADLDEDGSDDLIIAGNNFDAEVETPRYDAGTGLVLKGNGKGDFIPVLARQSGFYAPWNVKDVDMLDLAGGQNRLLILAVNDAAPGFFIVRKNALISMK